MKNILTSVAAVDDVENGVIKSQTFTSGWA
jgi:hypothetical protein